MLALEARNRHRDLDYIVTLSFVLFLRSLVVTVMNKLIPKIFHKTSELIELCLEI